MRHIRVKNHRRLARLVMAALSAAATTTALALTLGGHPLPPPATAEPPNCGVWNPGKQDCQAPPGNPPASRHDLSDIGTETFTTSRRHPIPSDIGTETITPSWPRPIDVPSDIGTETFTPQVSPPYSTPTGTPYPGH
jgi:uncharacterized membrane protein